VQPEDCGEIIVFLARLPAHVCINELTVSPTWNRGYVAQARGLQRG
jgi:NADP-dependent 3-hydroxy acid dehydrogenase YdfG